MRKSYEGRPPAGRRRIRPTIVLVLVVSLLGMPLAWGAQGRGKDSKQLGRHLKQGEGMAQVFQEVVGPMRTALQTLLAAEDGGATRGAEKLRKLAHRVGEQLQGMSRSPRTG